MTESFVFYRSFRDAIGYLDDATQLEIYHAVSDYALDGIIPENISPVAMAIFTTIRPQIDANTQRREAGLKPKTKKKEATLHEADTNSEATLTEISSDSEATLPKNNTNIEATLHKEAANPEANVNVNDNANANAKGNENAKANSNGESVKRKRFTPPTVDEVRDYCVERSNSIDPERFVDFYASKGWRVGNQPMRDWKAAVRTWENRDNYSGGPRSGTPPEHHDVLLDIINGRA